MSTFKKSVLSIVILSAITGSFISWDKYQPRHETPSMVEFYQNRELTDKDALLESLMSTDSDTLARIAEDNLLIEADLIAASISESYYSPEADEGYELEYEELTMKEETVQEKSEQTVNDVEKHEIIIKDRVLFAFDSSKLTAEYFPLLNKTARLMQDKNIDRSQIWQVVGYADFSGNYLYNSKLAQKRAQIVTEYLVNKGVNEQQLVTVSLGESQSEAILQSAENDRLARRVEIHEYQADVAILSDQFNAQLAREVSKNKKEVLLEIKVVQAEAKIVEKTESLKSMNDIDFAEQKVQSLITVMEL